MTSNNPDRSAEIRPYLDVSPRERGLPPKPDRWPTAEELAASFERQTPIQAAAIAKLRKDVPFASSRTLGIKVRSV